jgi:hypothetical protein
MAKQSLWVMGQQWGNGAMDGTMGGGQLPADEGTKMGATLGF